MKVMIAAIALLAMPGTLGAQVPTESFEEWHKRGPGWPEYPVGWYRGVNNTAKTEDAHDGRYAVMMWNSYVAVEGVIVTSTVPSEIGGRGPWPFELASAGVPIGYKPTRLTGYFRYERRKNRGRDDSAVVYVMLKRYNETTGTRDTIGFAHKHLGPAALYTPFTVDIADYAPGFLPDSIVIAFASSDSAFCEAGEGTDLTCCYLSIDDLQLSAPSGVTYDASVLFDVARIYPTPFCTAGYIEWSAQPGRIYTLRIYSITGAHVRTVGGLTGGSARIDREGLAAGEYLFELSDGSDRMKSQGRFIIE